MAQIHDKPVITIDAETIRKLLTEKTLLDHLKSSLRSLTISCPQRLNFPINKNDDEEQENRLLLMPSWSATQQIPYMGVKIVTSFPANSNNAMRGISASYVLADSLTGKHLSFIEGTEMTHWRTSCVSAMAAQYLARSESHVLAMLGAGQLAPYLIRAHVTALSPSLNKVLVWNRTPSRAMSLVASLTGRLGSVQVELCDAEDVDGIVAQSDVICCATSSTRPLVRGRTLRAGAHVDLVGSFCPSMAECDDETLMRARVFVDCPAALQESGELVGAFSRGAIRPHDVVGDLYDLVKGTREGRVSEDDVTVFKSVGSASVDLVTAQLIYEKFCNPI